MQIFYMISQLYQGPTRETDKSFAFLGLPSSCSAGKPQIHKILKSSAKRHIPQRHISNMTPNLIEITKRLIVVRDALLSSFPTDLQTHELNAQIGHNITECNRQRWIQTVESCSHKCNPSRLRGIIKSLNGKRTETPPNQPITFSSKSLTRNGELATAFVKTVHLPCLPYRRPVRPDCRSLLKDCPLSHFSPDIVSQAIKNRDNYLAVGQDSLSVHHLKNLGP